MLVITDENNIVNDPVEEPPETVEEAVEDSAEHVNAEVVDEENFIPDGAIPGGMGGLGALGNLFNKSSPDYSELFNTFCVAFEQQDQNMQNFNDALNNLVSQLNKYKRNQTWKMKIAYILILITWIIMFIKF